MHTILYAGGVASPKKQPQGLYRLVFHFEAANAAATQWEIFQTSGSDATGCLPDTNWVKRKAKDCQCPYPSATVGDFITGFTANGIAALAGQNAVVAGSQVAFELGHIAYAKWLKVQPVSGTGAGVSVTLETY